MPRIVLAALNARYLHAAFGLRYLMANLGDLRPEAALMEFEVQQRPLEIAEQLLEQDPEILGLGIYIWNVAPATELVALLRRVRPDLRIILGGPEVSHETEDQEIVRLADHVITGEADLAFAGLCRDLLRPGASAPPPKVLHAPLPDLARIVLPYDLYSEEDAAHRVIYVEASRGCPFTCEFCLSSLDIPVRAFPLDAFLAAMQGLLDRGVTRFKFVDRTFNLHLPTSRAILQFFLERWRPGLFVHFEMVPDRLPGALREIIARFPPGALQFEIGIQTLHPEVEERIRRRQDHARLEDNLRWLRGHSGVHLHADLIAGLPGESLESFGTGFDRLLALGPQEIQVGLLKRLRGTPIGRHDAAFAMRYGPMPPYEVLETRDLSFATLARLRRFSRFWDLFGNSGLFLETLPLLWADGGSPFAAFLEFSDGLHRRGVRTHGVAMLRQYELLWDHLIREAGLPEEEVRTRLQSDFRRAGRHEMPAWLREAQGDPRSPNAANPRRAKPLRRQQRHAPDGGVASADVRP